MGKVYRKPAKKKPPAKKKKPASLYPLGKGKRKHKKKPPLPGNGDINRMVYASIWKKLGAMGLELSVNADAMMGDDNNYRGKNNEDYCYPFVVKLIGFPEYLAEMAIIMPKTEGHSASGEGAVGGFWTHNNKRVLISDPEFEEKLIGDILDQMKSKSGPTLVALLRKQIRATEKMGDKLGSVVTQLEDYDFEE